jgi:hypothetical protein
LRGFPAEGGSGKAVGFGARGKAFPLLLVISALFSAYIEITYKLYGIIE